MGVERIMAFYNSSGIIGSLLDSATQDITGSMFLTLLIIFFILLVLGFATRLTMELLILFLTPMVLMLMGIDSGFSIIGGTFLMLIAVMMFKAFWLK